MSIEEDEILLTKKSPLHWQIVLNRPRKLNSFTLTMYEKMIDILREASEDEQLLLLSIRGQGNYFSSGADLSGPLKMSADDHPLEDRLDAAQKLLRRFIVALIDFPKILVGFVNGPAVGIGVTMLALFDGVYGSSASTYELPFTRTGQSPECCSSLTLVRQLGALHGKELLLFNRRLTSDEALQRGLITDILPADQFDELTAKIAEQIVALPRQSLLSSKDLINRWAKSDLHRVNDEELRLLRERWTSEEFIERIIAFSQRKVSSKL